MAIAKLVSLTVGNLLNVAIEAVENAGESKHKAL